MNVAVVQEEVGMWWFKKKKHEEKESKSIWKDDFSDCIAADFLPNYSVCQNEKNGSCRHVAHYAGMMLCSNPRHKSFIPRMQNRLTPVCARFRSKRA